MITSAPQLRGDDATARLTSLGLTEAVLQEAIEAAESGRRSRGPNDPPIVGPIVAWGACISSLRTNLAPHGWQKEDYKGMPLVVDESRDIGITVATGNAYTGIRGPASTKHPKGAATADLVAFNQLGLFPHHWSSTTSPPESTYFLLYHRTTTEIRAELSLPRTVKRRGKSVEITEWEERIILEPFSLSQKQPRTEQIEPAAEADVEVTPKDAEESA